MTLLDDLAWRGVLYDQTPDLADHLAGGSRAAYCGFDPTADSLHVGSLLPVMGLARLQRHGHRPVALVGGGTGLIGDPSGKRAERTLQTREQVEANAAGIRTQLERFLDFEGEHAARMVNNLDWLGGAGLLDFLRDVGKHFTVGAMTAKESVRSRLESEVGLSFTEFSYQLLQAYDFLVMYQRDDVTVQIGGSDQWGNITAGTDLIRRVTGRQGHGLVMPLVTNAAGTKFGKTESGAVWLDPERTSPYQFYQFWLNTDDRDAVPYLKAFTWLGQDEIAALDAEAEANARARPAQRALAREVTTIVHGAEATDAAERAGRVLFGDGDLRSLDAKTLGEVFEEAPSVALPAARFEGDGVPVLDLFVEAGLAQSKGEAKRLARGGGLRVNDEPVAEDAAVTAADAVGGAVVVLRKGKKSYALVRLER